jgi:hypothetical protein
VSECLHGWPGQSCGQAHPYIAEPAPLRGPASVTALPVAALLAEAQREVLAQALADAIEHRTPGFCGDCLDDPAGLCDDHADDLARTDLYLHLAAELGLEIDT